MDTRKFEPFKGAQRYETCQPAVLTYDVGEAYVPYAYAGYHEINQGEVRDASPTPLTSWSQQALSKPRFGEPVAKKRFHVLDLLSTGTAFASLALAIAAVAVEEFAWRLGTKNRQLVVLGFLLSIMNLCLNNVAPTFFLLLEARFGSSTLQNYDGILRNSILSSRLSFVWRLILGLTLVLPLGLSVAYKGFQGGEGAITINATTYINNASYYGMFAPPEIQGLGENTGISLFNNATLPFAVASAPQNGLELAVPAKPHPYGFNILLLNQNSTALLDVPQPSYVSGIQKLLTLGESWNLTAHVIGTVAAFNNSKDQDEDGYKSYFDEFCEGAADSSGAYAHQSMMNDRSLVLLSRPSFSNQSLQYIGLPPDPGIEWEVPCDDFYDYAKLYTISRQHCVGTWSVTRGGIQLIEGSCNGTLLPPVMQLPITQNTMFLPVWYMMTLVEFLGPFATTRNQSEWVKPYMATGVAAMLWSRITALISAQNLINTNPLPLALPQRQDDQGKDVSFEEIGLIYPVEDSVVYIRPTLRKSPWLYGVLAVQPLLTVVMLGVTFLFYSTPIDKGFGLPAILSGIESGSLDSLKGAALSGKLTKDVKLIICPSREGHQGTIDYRIEHASSTHRNERLSRNIIYY